RDGGRHVLCACELLTSLSINADEIRIAELADRVRPIALASRPKIAAGEAAEHSRSPGLCALALERVEDLFDRVAHADNRAASLSSGSRSPFSENPFIRNVHESQYPQGAPVAEGS